MRLYRWSAALLTVSLFGTLAPGLEAGAQTDEAAPTVSPTTAPTAASTAAFPSQRFKSAPAVGAMRASKIIGVSVIGMDHVRVGSVEDVLVDANGQIDTVVIGVGGFLGIGEKYVAVPFDLLAWNVGDVSLTSGPTSVSRPQSAASASEAAQVQPETMPGSDTTRDVLGSVEGKHSGRVTDATGSTDARKPTAERATVLAGDAGNDPVRAELRLTKAELAAAPAFRFDGRQP